MSDKDNIAKDIDALLNRTFALEVLVMIMMRDLLSSDAVDPSFKACESSRLSAHPGE